MKPQAPRNTGAKQAQFRVKQQNLAATSPIGRHSLPETTMRKPHARRRNILPLGIKNRIQTELPALVALTAIGEPWFSSAHQADLLAVALVVREIAPEGSLQAQCAAELQHRCEQAITADDKLGIALNLAECLPWLQVQQNHRVDHALQAVAQRYQALAA